MQLCDSTIPAITPAVACVNAFCVLVQSLITARAPPMAPSRLHFLVPLASFGGKGSFAASGAAAHQVRARQCLARCALASIALRAWSSVSLKSRERKPEKRRARDAREDKMEKDEIEEIRARVGCNTVLARAGFSVDVKESTRRAVKHRRDGDIIIVIHDGHGWFDPLSDCKGDVFSLIQHLERVTFRSALNTAAALIGAVPGESSWYRHTGPARPSRDLLGRWHGRRVPAPGTATWSYLRDQRCLPATVLHAAVGQCRLREGPYGSMWAAHAGADGTITGWEERGPTWRGFSTGGAKVLFRLGEPDATRLCVTEAAIDAMSLAAFEGLREGTLYLSTGGGWSPATEAAMRTLAGREGAKIFAATDANGQGEVFAARLRDIAERIGCDWMRMKPPAEDWNEALKRRMKEEEERRNERKRCRIPAGRVKGEAAPGFAGP